MAVNVLLRSRPRRPRTVGADLLGLRGVHADRRRVPDPQPRDGFQLGSLVDVGWVVGLLLLGGRGAGRTPRQPSPTSPAATAGGRATGGSSSARSSRSCRSLARVRGPRRQRQQSSRRGWSVNDRVRPRRSASPCCSSSPSSPRSARTSPSRAVSSRTVAGADAAQLTGVAPPPGPHLRAVDDGILGFDGEGTIMLANHAACSLLRLERVRSRRPPVVPDVLTLGPADHSLLTEILGDARPEDRPSSRHTRRSAAATAPRFLVAAVGRPRCSTTRSPLALGRRVPRRHRAARGRPDEGRVRVRRQPRAAHAADLDPRLARAARRRRRRRAPRGRAADGRHRGREHRPADPADQRHPRHRAHRVGHRRPAPGAVPRSPTSSPRASAVVDAASPTRPTSTSAWPRSRASCGPTPTASCRR